MTAWSLALSLITASAYLALILSITRGWYLIRRKVPAGKAGDIPGITIILPVRNEKERVEKAINSLSKQDFSKTITEVIVIDDHSTDDTVEFIRHLIQREQLRNFQLILMGNPAGRGSKKKAIEAGIRAANGEIILLTDADCTHGEGWAIEMATAIVANDAVMVAGMVVPEKGKGAVELFDEMEFLGLVASGAGAKGIGRPMICNGASLGFRKKAFYAVNGFRGNEHHDSGDDVFLLHKFKKHFSQAGIEFLLSPSAIVRTELSAGVAGFFSRRIRWASKSKGYRDAMALATALIVFSFSLVILASIPYSVIRSSYLAIILILLKILTDLPLLGGVTSFAGRRKLLWYLPVFELIHVFYVPVAGLAGLFRRNAWR
jgi:glycosyltransferase involved in cell wall biosynthesis